MDDLAPNPYAGVSSRPVHDRLVSLKLRTLGVAAAMVGAVLGGSWLLAAPLGRFTAQLYAMVLGQGDLPPAHVPLAAGTEVLLPHLAFVAVTAAAVMGHSLGAFGRLSARWVMVPPLAVGLAVALFAPPTTAWLQVVPSRLERDIMHGRFDAAEQALRAAGVSTEVAHYVQAQIALRAKDATALRQHGEPVLKAADQLAYGTGGGAAIAAQFQPRVVHAIDVALHGEPLSEVGLRLQREGPAAGAADWTLDAARLALGAAFVLAGWPLLQLWNQMRRRVARIQAGISPEEAPPPEEAPAVAEPGLRRRARHRAHTRPSSRTLRRLVRLSLMVMVISAVSAGVRHIRMAYVEENAGAARQRALERPSLALTACAFYGEWMASRQQSVYKVTLQPDGRFVAEPVARGEHAARAISGQWSVSEGSSLSWRYVGGPPSGRADVNPVLDYGSNGFTLLEDNGERTRYNLVAALPGRCAR